MNWYSKTASKPIRLPFGIEQDIILLAKDIARDAEKINLQDKLQSFRMLTFEDPYTKNLTNIEVLVGPRYLARGKGEARYESPYIFIWPRKNENWLDIASTIRHELAHAFDPKFNLSEPTSKMFYSEYIQSPEEFDAFTREFTEDLVADIQPIFVRNPTKAIEILERLKNLLRKGLNLRSFRYYDMPRSWSESLYDMVLFLNEEKKKTGDDRLIKKLWHRIYLAIEQAETIVRKRP